MAITNQERVGKAMELLQAGLAPFVERERETRLGKYWVTRATEWAAPRIRGAAHDNGLVQSFPEIVRLAREGGQPRDEQTALFEGDA